MARSIRPLLLVWLVWHLLVMSVDVSKHVSRTLPSGGATAPLQEALDTWASLRDPIGPWPGTEWYQWRVGVHQNWSMFVPNPRLSTSWLVVEGVRPDKSRVPLPLVVGRPDPNGVIWSYARAGKHERNAEGGHRERLRMAYTRYYCRVMAARGEPLRSVEFFIESQATPPPERRGETPREQWPVSRRKAGGWNCPR
ncbi:MAG: hypothetical protein KC656_05140 [Myxococcales bacterium]|nr:hypothetical protein [Myxococcales bacterium]MCB9672952.1 hypothetical protein [Alphaproteobacteria bacterium]